MTECSSPFGVEDLAEEDVVLERAVHDPGLLRDVGERAVDRDGARLQRHAAQHGRQQRRLTGAHGTANGYQSSLSHKQQKDLIQLDEISFFVWSA